MGEIIAIIVSLMFLALLGVTGAIYIRRSKRPVNKTKTFEEKREDMGVTNNGTSMNGKEIYAFSASDIGFGE